jgi:MOSC domain-containing protein YiiM
MKVISVNVGLPRPVMYNGEPASTGIYKTPVAGPVKVNEVNLAGDAQADLSVHGGYYKAVYVYPFEHYEFWQGELSETELPLAIFGENLTTIGLLETEVCIGDKLRIGTAEFVVTQPRFPCFKLGIRFGRKDIIRRFQKSKRSGFYLAILKTGEIQANDSIEIFERDQTRFSIAEAITLRDEGVGDLEKVRRALEIEALPESWKTRIRKSLNLLHI